VNQTAAQTSAMLMCHWSVESAHPLGCKTYVQPPIKPKQTAVVWLQTSAARLVADCCCVFGSSLL